MQDLLKLLEAAGWTVTRRKGEQDHRAWFDEIWVLESRWSPHGFTLFLTFFVDPQPGNPNPFWLIGTSFELPKSSSEAQGEPSLKVTPNWRNDLAPFVASLNALRLGKRFNLVREANSAFVDQVAQWIAADGEVFVILRWVGGFRDFALCRSRAEFERLVEVVCDGTEIIAMRGRRLPIRGRVTDELLDHALEAVPEGTEYLAISLVTKPNSPMAAAVASGDSREDLAKVLRDWMGMEVAVGVCPKFWAADDEGLISRAKGGVEGPR
jgi:hypothetical protein